MIARKGKGRRQRGIKKWSIVYSDGQLVRERGRKDIKKKEKETIILTRIVTLVEKRDLDGVPSETVERGRTSKNG